MPVRQPLTQARRQQQLLLTITRQEVLAHHTTPASTTSTRMVLTAPDSTNPPEARVVRQPLLRAFCVSAELAAGRLENGLDEVLDRFARMHRRPRDHQLRDLGAGSVALE